MYPILRNNDIVYFKKIGFSQAKENDVLLIYKNSQFIVHRLIYKTRNYVITKGDNNDYNDGKISKRNIVGRAISIKRGRQCFNIKHFYLIQSSLYFKQTEIINQTLKNNGVDFIFIKGLPIYIHYFKKHSNRYYYDCDFLISSLNKKRVIKIMKKLGYKKIQNDILNKEENYWQESYYKIVGGFPIIFDIHYQVSFLMTQINTLNHIYPLKLVDKLSKQIINNKKLVKINGYDYPIISKVNLVFLLLLHFFHHNYQNIYQLNKINKLIIALSKEQLNQLIVLIKNYKVNKYLYPCFYYLNKYFKTSVSTFFLGVFTLENKQTINIVDRLKLNIFDNKNRIDAGIIRFKILFYLSPQPLITRIFIFINKKVIGLIYKVLLKKIMKFF